MQIISSLLTIVFFCAFTSSLQAKECFDISPVVDSGGDIYIDQDIPLLTAKQYNDLKNILNSATGKWSGTMAVKECFGTKSSLTVKEENYEVKGDAEFDGELFELMFELYSLESKTRKTTTLKYALTDEYLSLDTRQTGIAEVLTTTSTGVTYYKRFRQIQAGKPGSFVKETSYVFEASGREIVMKEFQYINGELISESVLKLQ